MKSLVVAYLLAVAGVLGFIALADADAAVPVRPGLAQSVAAPVVADITVAPLPIAVATPETCAGVAPWKVVERYQDGRPDVTFDLFCTIDAAGHAVMRGATP